MVIGHFSLYEFVYYAVASGFKTIQIVHDLETDEHMLVTKIHQNQSVNRAFILNNWGDAEFLCFSDNHIIKEATFENLHAMIYSNFSQRFPGLMAVVLSVISKLDNREHLSINAQTFTDYDNRLPSQLMNDTQARIVTEIDKDKFIFVDKNDKAISADVWYLRNISTIKSLKELGYNFKNADEFFTFSDNPFKLRIVRDRYGCLTIITPQTTDPMISEVHDIEDQYVCACRGPQYGFDCNCEWIRNNPGDTKFSCEFHGPYKASSPQCGSCEIRD